MTKVEELRRLLIYDLTEYYKTAAVNLGKRAEPEAIEMTDSLISAAREEGKTAPSVTWARKYSLANASGVSCLVGKFPNGYRLDLENADIPDGDYDLIPRRKP